MLTARQCEVTAYWAEESGPVCCPCGHAMLKDLGYEVPAMIEEGLRNAPDACTPMIRYEVGEYRDGQDEPDYDQGEIVEIDGGKYTYIAYVDGGLVGLPQSYVHCVQDGDREPRYVDYIDPPALACAECGAELED